MRPLTYLMRLIVAVIGLLPIVAFATNPLGGGNVTAEQGVSTAIYGQRAIMCGDPAPSFAFALGQISISPQHGTLSDGGVGSRFSGACMGVVPVRLVNFLADDGFLGLDLMVISGDTVNITVIERSAAVGEETPGSVTTVAVGVENSIGRQIAPALTSAIQGGLRAITPGQRSALGLRRVGQGFALEGRSAGDGVTLPWGVWGSYQHSDIEDDFVGTAFEGKTNNVLVGADISPMESMLVGVAIGFEQSDTDTRFNNGEVELTGVTVAPYLGVLFAEQLGASFDLGLDVSLGYGTTEIEQFRTDPVSNSRIFSTTDGERWFISANVTASRSFGDLYIAARGGLLLARDRQNAFVESNGTQVAEASASLGRLMIGGEAAYRAGAFEPYLSATYENDIQRERIVTNTAAQPSNDSDDVLFAVGLRWLPSDSVSASVEYNTVLGRTDFEARTVQAVFRADF